MIYHLIDLFLLKEILNKKDTTTWEIAKKFVWEDKPLNFKNKKEAESFFRDKTSYICARLKAMEKVGIIKITKNEHRNKNVYEIDSKKVILKKQKFPDNSFGNVLCIKENFEKWQIFQV